MAVTSGAPRHARIFEGREIRHRIRFHLGVSLVATPMRLVILPVVSLIYYYLLLLNFPTFYAYLGHIAYVDGENPDKLIASYVIVFVVSACLAAFVRTHRTIVGLFSYLIFYTVFIPICVVYCMADRSTAFVVSSAAGLVLAFILFGHQKPAGLVRNPHADRLFVLVFAGIALGMLAFFFVQGALHYSFVGLYEVYALRLGPHVDFGTTITRLMMISAYTATSVLLAYGVLYRNVAALGVATLNSYLLYATFAFKLFLFVVPIGLCAYLYLRMRNPAVLPVLLCVIMLAVYLLTDSSNPLVFYVVDNFNQILVRRFLYLQPYLAFAWHDVFVDKAPILMSNSPPLKYIFEYPFQESYYEMVAWEIYGRELVPNTGIFGTGYAHFGLPGIIGSTVFVYALLLYIDRTASRIRSGLPVIASAMPAILFFEAEPLTAIISFGFGLIVVMCWVARRLVRPRTQAVRPRVSPLGALAAG